jgi:hypothetical protein
VKCRNGGARYGNAREWNASHIVADCIACNRMRKRYINWWQVYRDDRPEVRMGYI